ncbi:MAG: hypothetical protein QY309_13160 [Cyclobacteriaceae bacterium]|nr:MAG: hypothetical protein QY309_13160 [Cyclobacteriaceae bacterium]
MKKGLIGLVGLIILLGLWYWTEESDYFRADYNDLTLEETSVFEAEPDPTMIYRSHIGNKKYEFPRQTVDKVKIFQNTPFISSLTSKTLKEKFTTDFVNFFNDSTNFDWGETTWSYRGSEYILRFYSNDKIVGKIYLCLDGCGMTDSRPFTPNMKFGGLTNEGQEKLELIINDNQKWE